MAWVRIAHLAVLFIGLGVTIAVLGAPEATAGRHDPQLRVVIEVSALFLALFAALVLGVTERKDLGPARDAFIAALLVLAVTNVTFSTIVTLVDVRPAADHGMALYPWAVSRFVAGGLLLAATLQRPRGGLTRTLIGALTVLVCLQVALHAASNYLPALVTLTGPDASPVIHEPGILALVQLLPAVMFGGGAWLAMRLYVRSGTPLYAWLSVAMSVQVLAQIHGLLVPAFLGPWVTTMDLFRSTAWVLLAGGAVAQLRHLYLTRSRTAEQQAQDLEQQSALIAQQQALAEQEADFRAVVSHEMATPIAALRAFTHVLSSANATPGQKGDALAGLDAEVGRLNELIGRVDELRDVDSTGAACLLRPMAIRPLLEEIQDFAVGLPGRTCIVVDCQDDRVLADPVRLGQLLRNLVGNSAKYSPPGSPVHLVGRRGSPTTYEITVKDQGPGIQPEERERVLRRYARGSNVSETPGTGLGLYLASRIAEAHNGRLEVRAATNGHGSEILVTLERAT